jgi:hypothetical protein
LRRPAAEAYLKSTFASAPTKTTFSRRVAMNIPEGRLTRRLSADIQDGSHATLLRQLGASATQIEALTEYRDERFFREAKR